MAHSSAACRIQAIVVAVGVGVGLVAEVAAAAGVVGNSVPEAPALVKS